MNPRALLLTALLAALPRLLIAQEVRGRITGEASGAPLTGVFAVLIDSTGAPAGGSLSSDQGLYSIQARAAGTYRIRVERLGLEAEVSPPLVLDAGARVVYDITVAEKAVTLPAVTVTGRRAGCRAFGELDDATATVWEEARKALAVASWTAAYAPVRLYIVRSLTERYAGSDRQLLAVADSTSREMRGSPWNSAPAQSLVKLGFVRQHQGGYLYYGPDADVLLSDVFLAGHCFRVVEHADSAALVGLEFRPRGDGRVSDIQGTLWLDRASSELRRLEYEYVRLPYELANEHVGGTASYLRLESGMWILAGWSMEAPRPLTNSNGTSGRRQTLLMSEHAARVVRVTHRNGRTLYVAPDHEARTVPASELVGTSGRRAMDIPIPGGSMPARLWAAQRCAGAPQPDRIHVVGVVLGADGAPIPGATVQLATMMPTHIEDRAALADADGLYWFCNAPANQPYRIEARAPAHESSAESAEPAAAGEVAGHRFTLVRS